MSDLFLFSKIFVKNTVLILEKYTYDCMAERDLREEEVERGCSKALVALIFCQEETVCLHMLDKLFIIIVDHLDV